MQRALQSNDTSLRPADKIHRCPTSYTKPSVQDESTNECRIHIGGCFSSAHIAALVCQGQTNNKLKVGSSHRRHGGLKERWESQRPHRTRCLILVSDAGVV